VQRRLPLLVDRRTRASSLRDSSSLVSDAYRAGDPLDPENNSDCS
jgi:hypothetical protein